MIALDHFYYYIHLRERLDAFSLLHRRNMILHNLTSVHNLTQTMWDFLYWFVSLRYFCHRYAAVRCGRNRKAPLFAHHLKVFIITPFICSHKFFILKQKIVWVCLKEMHGLETVGQSGVLQFKSLWRAFSLTELQIHKRIQILSNKIKTFDPNLQPLLIV